MRRTNWDLAINDRERKKELETRLYEIDDFIANRFNISDKEDLMEDERIYIMKKDREAIFTELESLGSTEERYQEALDERSEELKEIDTDVRSFLDGVDNVVSDLNVKDQTLSEAIEDAKIFQKQFEGIISSLGGAELEQSLKSELTNLSQQIYASLQVKLQEYGDQIFENIPSNFDSLSIWDIYTNNDELINNINAELQNILTQKIELQMRKEEYIEGYSDKDTE